MSEKPCATVEPEAARARLAAKNGRLVDVREASELDALRVEGALNLPLSRLRELAASLDRNEPVYLLCGSGSRAASAAAQLTVLGHTEIFIVRGGLDAWTNSGGPVVRGESRIWSMERQVRFAAGALVFTGTALGLTVHRGFLLIAAFVSAGLMFSAVTDTCTMALVLARLPWNRGSCGR